MKKSLVAMAVVALGASFALVAPAQAKTTKPATKKAVKKPVSKKGGKLKKALKVNPVTGASAPLAATPVPGTPFPASPVDVYTGTMHCEFGTTVNIAPDAGDKFLYHVSAKGMSYSMRQVPTSTGVVRLEDKAAGATWLQMGNKSMLMDQKRGERVADACRNAQQNVREEELKRNPVNILN